MNWRRGILILATLPFLMAALCSKGPSSSVPDPDLDNIWPNEDGNWWEYSASGKSWMSFEEFEAFLEANLYESEDLVPAAPAIGEITELFDPVEPGDVVEFHEGSLRLEFDGTITTASGVTAQNLAETLVWEGRRESPRGGVLARIAVARPDLEELLGLSQEEVAGSRERLIFQHWILQGMAFTKTNEFIGGYGDLNQDLAWLVLEANLAIGHEFSIQLVPDLADDIWLHGMIEAHGSWETDEAEFENCVSCVYMIDYGSAGLLGNGPYDILGYYRLIDIGRAIYAPEVGPVFGQELHFIIVLDELSDGVGDQRFTLTESSESQ